MKKKPPEKKKFKKSLKAKSKSKKGGGDGYTYEVQPDGSIHTIDQCNIVVYGNR